MVVVVKTDQISEDNFLKIGFFSRKGAKNIPNILDGNASMETAVRSRRRAAADSVMKTLRLCALSDACAQASGREKTCMRQPHDRK
jgi:hypothetical protein